MLKWLWSTYTIASQDYYGSHGAWRRHVDDVNSEDKELVQIAFQFEREGLRITWDYVARRMRTSARQSSFDFG
ncbi:hypothetical protein GQ600_27634 [Phytophthora cactorum]|nr:hypothetical protein GQ600_27634 [Phytophthora cactorum]